MAEFNLSAVLDQANIDTRNGRFERALSGFVYYFENSRGVPGTSGVRISFVLAYWRHLASLFPPAMDELIRFRDAAEVAFLETSDLSMFSELAALNRKLDRDFDTLKVFRDIGKVDFVTATRMYPDVEAILVREGKFEECLLYLNWDKRVDNAIDFFHACLRVLTEQDAKDHFQQDMIILIWILVSADRVDDAEKVTALVLDVSDDQDFREAIRAAFKGELRTTWKKYLAER